MNLHRLTILALFLFVALRAYLSFVHFYFYPVPSDQLQYFTPALFGAMDFKVQSFGNMSMARGGWPWLDRICLASGLRLATYLPVELTSIAPIYAFLVLTATMVIGFIWVYRQTNFIGAMLFGVLFNSSYLVNIVGSEILPEPLLTLFGVLALVCYSRSDTSARRYVLAGFFAAFCPLTKATGAIVPIFFGLCCLFETRRVRATSLFIIGGLLGTAIAMALFVLLFDSSQLVTTATRFFGDNIAKNYHGRTRVNNFVSYISVFFAMIHLPVFAFLFVNVRAVKHKATQHSFLFAWALIASIYAVYYLTERGYRPLPRYVYPAAVVGLMSLAAYFGHIWSSVQTKELTARRAGLILLTTFGLLLVGGMLSYGHSPLSVFQPRDLGDFSRLLGALYGVGAMLIFVVLMLLEMRVTKTLMYSLFFLALWCGALPGGAALYKAEALRTKAEWYYDHAKFFKMLSDSGIDEVDVFNTEWNKDPWGWRLPWVFHLFYEDRTNRSYQVGDEHRRLDYRVHRPKERFYLERATRRFTITDAPERVLEMAAKQPPPNAMVEIDRMTWRGQELVVLERTQPKPKDDLAD